MKSKKRFNLWKTKLFAQSIFWATLFRPIISKYIECLFEVMVQLFLNRLLLLHYTYYFYIFTELWVGATFMLATTQVNLRSFVTEILKFYVQFIIQILAEKTADQSVDKSLGEVFQSKVGGGRTVLQMKLVEKFHQNLSDTKML